MCGYFCIEFVDFMLKGKRNIEKVVVLFCLDIILI